MQNSILYKCYRRKLLMKWRKFPKNLRHLMFWTKYIKKNCWWNKWVLSLMWIIFPLHRNIGMQRRLCEKNRFLICKRKIIDKINDISKKHKNFYEKIDWKFDWKTLISWKFKIFEELKEFFKNIIILGRICFLRNCEKMCEKQIEFEKTKQIYFIQ